MSANFELLDMKKFSLALCYCTITILSLSLLQCTADKAPIIDTSGACVGIEASYDTNIKAILNNSCALGGCHVNGGDGPGNYISYSNILPFLEDGSFKRTTVDQKDDPIIGMPPDWSINGAPKDLTEFELELITCWLEAGYPE